MTDAVSRLTLICLHFWWKFENFKSTQLQLSHHSFWWLLRSRFMINLYCTIIGKDVWSIWRMLWVDWCQFTYIFDEQLSKFRVDTRLVEWSLILMIVTVQIYDNFMFLYHWKGCLIDWTDGVSRLISMELHFAFSVLAKNLRISPKPSLRVAVQSVIILKLFENSILVICKRRPKSWKKQHEAPK